MKQTQNAIIHNPLDYTTFLQFKSKNGFTFGTLNNEYITFQNNSFNIDDILFSNDNTILTATKTINNATYTIDFKKDTENGIGIYATTSDDTFIKLKGFDVYDKDGNRIVMSTITGNYMLNEGNILLDTDFSLTRKSLDFKSKNNITFGADTGNPYLSANPGEFNVSMQGVVDISSLGAIILTAPGEIKFKSAASNGAAAGLWTQALQYTYSTTSFYVGSEHIAYSIGNSSSAPQLRMDHNSFTLRNLGVAGVTISDDTYGGTSNNYSIILNNNSALISSGVKSNNAYPNEFGFNSTVFIVKSESYKILQSRNSQFLAQGYSNDNLAFKLEVTGGALTYDIGSTQLLNINSGGFTIGNSRITDNLGDITLNAAENKKTYYVKNDATPTDDDEIATKRDISNIDLSGYIPNAGNDIEDSFSLGRYNIALSGGGGISLYGCNSNISIDDLEAGIYINGSGKTIIFGDDGKIDLQSSVEITSGKIYNATIDDYAPCDITLNSAKDIILNAAENQKVYYVHDSAEPTDDDEITTISTVSGNYIPNAGNLKYDKNFTLVRNSYMLSVNDSNTVGNTEFYIGDKNLSFCSDINKLPELYIHDGSFDIKLHENSDNEARFIILGGDYNPVFTYYYKKVNNVINQTIGVGGMKGNIELLNDGDITLMPVNNGIVTVKGYIRDEGNIVSNGVPFNIVRSSDISLNTNSGNLTLKGGTTTLTANQGKLTINTNSPGNIEVKAIYGDILLTPDSTHKLYYVKNNATPTANDEIATKGDISSVSGGIPNTGNTDINIDFTLVREDFDIHNSYTAGILSKESDIKVFANQGDVHITTDLTNYKAYYYDYAADTPTADREIAVKGDLDNYVLKSDFDQLLNAYNDLADRLNQFLEETGEISVEDIDTTFVTSDTTVAFLMQTETDGTFTINWGDGTTTDTTIGERNQYGDLEPKKFEHTYTDNRETHTITFHPNVEDYDHAPISFDDRDRGDDGYAQHFSRVHIINVDGDYDYVSIDEFEVDKTDQYQYFFLDGSELKRLIVGENCSSIFDGQWDCSETYNYYNLEYLYIKNNQYMPEILTYNDSYGGSSVNTTLKEIHFTNTTPPDFEYGWDDETYGEAFRAIISNDLKVYVPAEAVDVYKAAEGYSIWADYIIGY